MGIATLNPREDINNKMFPEESSRSKIDDSLSGNIPFALAIRGYRYAQPTAKRRLSPGGEGRGELSVFRVGR